MEELLKMLNLTGLGPDLKNRIILSFFCFLIFVLIFYFWIISRKKIKANHKNGSGLVYMAFAFFLLALIGFFAVVVGTEDKTPFLIMSGLVSFCYITALSFFSVGSHKLDDIVTTQRWKNGVSYVAFGWIILVSFAGKSSFMGTLDMILTVVALASMGFFIARYFVLRNLKFLAGVTAFYFTGFILLQILQPASLEGGKYTHINTIILGPSLPLAVIVLAYTFNWINELNFYELANIWVGTAGGDESEESHQKAYSEITVGKGSSSWMERVASDEIEEVIQEMIISKKHQNENLEFVLNIASRNTRNNNNHLKNLIRYEEYQLNRNQISNSLVGLLKDEGE
ncbi:MAG: hypothetical protein AB8F95_12210 [Bacteroidia bacterium]